MQLGPAASSTNDGCPGARRGRFIFIQLVTLLLGLLPEVSTEHHDEYAGESYDELHGEAQEEVYTYDVDEERTENNDDRRSISIDSDYRPCY
jgi:hypothetical protein